MAVATWADSRPAPRQPACATTAEAGCRPHHALKIDVDLVTVVTQDRTGHQFRWAKHGEGDGRPTGCPKARIAAVDHQMEYFQCPASPFTRPIARLSRAATS